MCTFFYNPKDANSHHLVPLGASASRYVELFRLVVIFQTLCSTFYHITYKYIHSALAKQTINNEITK